MVEWKAKYTFGYHDQCMIREEEEYMRDFVSDDDDHIIGIGFDYIKKKEV